MARSQILSSRTWRLLILLSPWAASAFLFNKMVPSSPSTRGTHHLILLWPCYACCAMVTSDLFLIICLWLYVTGSFLAPQSRSQSSRVSGTALFAKRRRKSDADADYERFDLDELRDEKRFEAVEEMDPEMYRPSKMEYYVPPPTDVEYWDIPDTR